MPCFALAGPTTPTGLCINNSNCVSDANKAGFFPGSNIKFFPGFIIASSQDESPAAIEARWQAFFTTEGNRKESYRPPGVYGSVSRRLAWKHFYVDQRVRPQDPEDHKDPAYDWSKIDSVFAINAVQNESARVFIQIGDISYTRSPRAPAWLGKPPYNGFFIAGIDGGSGTNKTMLKYYRYSVRDSRGKSRGASPGIVEEFAYFHKALHDHLVATGNIDKVMAVAGGGETYLGKNFVPPADWNAEDMKHGAALRYKLLADIWGQSNIHVFSTTITSNTTREIAWPYMQNPIVGMAYPDMKLNGTNNISAPNRFDGLDGNSQEDVRPLIQFTESNGQRDNTYFAPDIPNPWGYSNVSVSQTASHILWTLSGSPKGHNKDSSLGQAGEDPSGLIPVHYIVVDFDRSWQKKSPSIEEWHDAVDTFGPPGTFAFPYLPKGYQS